AMEQMKQVGTPGTSIDSQVGMPPNTFMSNNPLREFPAETAHDQYEIAADSMEKSLAIDPENAALQLTLGWVYLDRLHEPQQAYPHLADAARWHPGDVNARK